MMQLPSRFEPWRPWLSLFPVDLAEPLGELLLRLHPQLGPLRSMPSRSEALPEGVGSIVARGQYERLLMSEWAIAEAEPDEFLRRAGSGELMFTGPEPAARQRSRRCVALFDAGPLQLGEPRLLHMALFILLARRAEEAGASYQWGLLQQPGVLHQRSGKEGLRQLLAGRTLGAADAASLEAWHKGGNPAEDDIWIIGAPRLPAPFPARAHVGIRRQLAGELLDVTIRQKGSVRVFSLALPEPDVGVRLLRSPFEPLASNAAKHKGKGRPSLVMAPRFAVYGRAIAVHQLDGSVALYKVPSSVRESPGKTSYQRAPEQGSILAAGVFGKSFAAIVSDGNVLGFRGFQTAALSGKSRTVPRPGNDQFKAPPHTARWLPCFFLKGVRVLPTHREEELAVISLDTGGKLVAWTTSTSTSKQAWEKSPIAFRVLSEQVVGVEQFGDLLVFAVSGTDSTLVYRWNVAGGSAEAGSLPYRSSRVLFTDGRSWSHSRSLGVGAMELEDGQWRVFDGSGSRSISVPADAKVFGVARTNPFNDAALIIMRKFDKMTIQVRTVDAQSVLVQSPEPIAQVAVCARSGDIAWIGASTRKLTVRGIDQSLPFLEVAATEASDGQ